jgi:hypothetical protein
MGFLTKFDLDCSSELDVIVELSINDIDAMGYTTKTVHDFFEDTYAVVSGQYHDFEYASAVPLFVVKYAKFAGRLNKENVPIQVERLRARKDSKRDIQYILLNVDYTVRH